MAIQRKAIRRTNAHRSPLSTAARGELVKANLKRFHELIQSHTAAAAPEKPEPVAPEPPARAPIGEVISPRSSQGGVSSVRAAQASRQLRNSVKDMRDMLRHSSFQLLEQQSMEEIVQKANEIANMAATGVQLTGQITQYATAAELYRSQRSGPVSANGRPGGEPVAQPAQPTGAQAQDETQ